ncbi:hypothetical protein A3H11_02145 [Candidatus Uhrbacteria bacterium RIFCSPLOWO2_12_FULL_47_10]|nr:MAG: hypothetical protein A3J03_04390 [Candidatus Uhrbacteria bacterium RIFCSPLOWO2_02_FULL_46_25]OGL92300.1 MAG: hypothetical protein A3H11_02145 [Candidatus Uhrbacteria bacterium RIFCSPLOWO2_12_FULL_47_10]
MQSEHFISENAMQNTGRPQSEVTRHKRTLSSDAQAAQTRVAEGHAALEALREFGPEVEGELMLDTAPRTTAEKEAWIRRQQQRLEPGFRAALQQMFAGLGERGPGFDNALKQAKRIYGEAAQTAGEIRYSVDKIISPSLKETMDEYVARRGPRHEADQPMVS